MGFAIHTIVSTMFLSVFGPGLALRGPEGSMHKAVRQMAGEQKAILLFFVLTIVSFAMMTASSFWLCMTYEAASVSTAVLCVFAIYWYRSCKKIYLSFLVRYQMLLFSSETCIDLIYIFAHFSPKDERIYPLQMNLLSHLQW